MARGKTKPNQRRANTVHGASPRAGAYSQPEKLQSTIAAYVQKLPENKNEWFARDLDEEYNWIARNPELDAQVIETMVNIGRVIEEQVASLWRREYEPALLELHKAKEKLERRLQIPFKESDYHDTYGYMGPSDKLDRAKSEVQNAKRQLRQNKDPQIVEKLKEELEKAVKNERRYQIMHTALGEVYKKIEAFESNVPERECRMRVLRTIRDFGGRMDNLQYEGDNEQLGRVAGRALGFVPTDWIREHNQTDAVLFVHWQKGFGAPAHYRPILSSAGTGIIELDPTYFDDDNPNSTTTVMVHEIYHHLERRFEHLGRAGNAYRRARRAKHGEDGAFRHHYANRDYGSEENNEVLTVGVEMLFDSAGHQPAIDRIDEEHLSFVMGLLVAA